MCRYLKAARERFNTQLDGFELSPEDVYAMQMMCAYEVYSPPSKFANNLLIIDGARLLLSDIPSSASSSLLKSGKDSITRRGHERIRCFTHAETLCSLDLHFWYDSAFGSPFGKIFGIGYVQELVARLTQTPIPLVSSNTPRHAPYS